MESDDVYLVMNYKWRAGVGQICLGVATFLKILDIIFNIMVRAPTITRDYLEQVEYEWKYGPESQLREDNDEKEESNCNDGHDRVDER